jgi:DNA gyrase subunit A
VNLIPGFLAEDRIQAVIPIDDFEHGTLLFATGNGTVKRTALLDYARPKSGGIIALGLDEGDRLIDVAVCKDEDDIILGTETGMSIRFKASDVRIMGRPAVGVRGIRLKDDDKVCGMAVVSEGASLLTVCRNGYGKRTDFAEYPQQGRGGLGVINIRSTERNGPVVTLRAVHDEDDILYISANGNVVRTPAAEISKIGRGTQGVRLVTLAEGDAVASATRVDKEEGGDGSPEGDGSPVPEGGAPDSDPAAG